MNVARTIPALVALVIAIVLAVVLVGGDDRYTLRVMLDDAAGLKERSPVRLKGADVGQVTDLAITDDDDAVATVELDREAGPVGRGAHFRVVPANLLGEKVLSLTPGDAARPLPDGSSISRRHTSASVDLDDVLHALDPSTRFRLGVLLRESARAFDRRGGEMHRLIPRLPRGLDSMRDLISQLGTDTATLERLVVTSDRVLHQVNAERSELGGLVDTARAALRVPARQADDLRATISEAPSTLTALRRTLKHLDRTGAALRPAATGLRRTAAPLTQVVSALPGFQRAAEPALREVGSVSPALARLGRGLTPTVRSATGVISRLRAELAFGEPTFKSSAKAFPEILGFVEGWGLANQLGDDAGSFYTGTTTLSPELQDIIARVIGGRPTPASKRKRAAKPRPAADATRPQAPISAIQKTVGNVLSGLGVPRRPAEPSANPAEPSANPAEPLLDFLLGP